MDTEQLAELVPEMMRAYSSHSWRFLDTGGSHDPLRFEVWPVSDPTRVAKIDVMVGAQVYTMWFERHADDEFAWEFEDRVEVLNDRIALAVAATTGPTRVVLTLAGDRLIASRMILDPNGPSPQERAAASWPFRRLIARLRRRPIIDRVIDVPAL